MKITINKSQWEAMGKQAGWMKKAKEDIPLKSVPYRGFTITIHQPETSAKQGRDLYHYKIDGILTEGNSQGLIAVIEKARKTVDRAIAASPGGGHDEILEHIKPFASQIGYAPGQTPYTPTELKIHDKMISDAIKGDPGEGNEDDVSRRRSVIVTFSDGDTITTWINGTKKEIMNYYLPNGKGVDQDYDDNQPQKLRHPVKVEFIG